MKCCGKMQVLQSFMDSADTDTPTANMLQVNTIVCHCEECLNLYREKFQWLEKATTKLFLGVLCTIKDMYVDSVSVI